MHNVTIPVPRLFLAILRASTAQQTSNHIRNDTLTLHKEESEVAPVLAPVLVFGPPPTLGPVGRASEGFGAEHGL